MSGHTAESRTIAQQIAWALAESYAGATHGNYDEDVLYHRSGTSAAQEVERILSDCLGVRYEALESGVVDDMLRTLYSHVRNCPTCNGTGKRRDLRPVAGMERGVTIPACPNCDQSRRVIEKARGEAAE